MIRDRRSPVSGLLSREDARPVGHAAPARRASGGARTTPTTGSTSPGEDRYRRGLYTSCSGPRPTPRCTTFDAPSREICTVRRITTNTPLQALVTLNDPVYVEAAQALARRMVREAGSTPTTGSRYGLQLWPWSGRPSRARSRPLVAAVRATARAYYRDHRDEAAPLATDPLGPLPDGWDAAELAALTSVCNVILNLDEFLTRD